MLPMFLQLQFVILIHFGRTTLSELSYPSFCQFFPISHSPQQIFLHWEILPKHRWKRCTEMVHISWTRCCICASLVEKIVTHRILLQLWPDSAFVTLLIKVCTWNMTFSIKEFIKLCHKHERLYMVVDSMYYNSSNRKEHYHDTFPSQHIWFRWYNGHFLWYYVSLN
jgi:hypothetical protein